MTDHKSTPALQHALIIPTAGVRGYSYPCKIRYVKIERMTPKMFFTKERWGQRSFRKDMYQVCVFADKESALFKLRFMNKMYGVEAAKEAFDIAVEQIQKSKEKLGEAVDVEGWETLK